MPDPPFDYGQYDTGRHLNYWAMSPPLQAAAERVYPDDEFAWGESVLAEFGDVVGHTIADTADRLDDNPPELQTYDEHGDLLNAVHYHPDQIENEALIYERGIVADAFESPPGREEPVGLLHTLTMQLLLSTVDTGLVCSQSMTSGAALVLDRHDHDGHFDAYLDRMTSRHPGEVIEGAMFMTEEQGGSDVGATETVAEPVSQSEGPEHLADRTYELTGEKWFCSNIDAQVTLALAHRQGAPEGTDGLSLFLVPHRLPSGELNDQTYRRLKDKLGTKSVPTGEVEFHETTAYLVGDPERGFTYMTTMLNWERVTNAVGAVGIIDRLRLESMIHAANREAFGQPIESYPLMQRDLVEMTVTHEATLAFAMEAARWFDQADRDPDDDEAFRLLRVLVPVAKHVTTRRAVETASYAMEIQGGNGYVSDFVTHRLLRDAQALPIWEGTANILSLDVLRGMETDATHEALLPLIEETLDAVSHPYLGDVVDVVREEAEALQAALLALASADPEAAQHEAKVVTETIYDVLTAALLLARAQDALEAGDGRKAIVATLFVSEAVGDTALEGVGTDEALPMQYFDAIVRHETIDPAELPDDPPGI